MPANWFGNRFGLPWKHIQSAVCRTVSAALAFSCSLTLTKLFCAIRASVTARPSSISLRLML